MTIIKKAAIDRFEETMAVLVIDGKPLNVLRSELPKDVKEGDWLEMEFEGDRLVSAQEDEGEKEKMKKRIEEKLARLRRKK